MSRIRKIARIIRCTPVYRCKSRNEVCQEHRLSTNLLLQELRRLEQSGETVVLPESAEWGSPPINEGEVSVSGWQYFKCELCGAKYYAPRSK